MGPGPQLPLLPEPRWTRLRTRAAKLEGTLCWCSRNREERGGPKLSDLKRCASQGKASPKLCWGKTPRENPALLLRRGLGGGGRGHGSEFIWQPSARHNLLPLPVAPASFLPGTWPQELFMEEGTVLWVGMLDMELGNPGQKRGV